MGEEHDGQAEAQDPHGEIDDQEEYEEEDEFEPDATEAEAVRRMLDENDLDPETALIVLVSTLVQRHINCELHKLGRRPQWTKGNERTNALVATQDALWEASAKYSGITFAPPPAGPKPPGSAEETAARDAEAAAKKAEEDAHDNDVALEGLTAAELGNLQQTLMRMLSFAQMAGERRTGLSDIPDEDDDSLEKPWMRLVKD